MIVNRDSEDHVREVLSALTHQDVDAVLPFMGCTTMDVGLIRARVSRISVCGELGYEINCSAAAHITLREILLEAGAEQNIREFGFYAMNALRLEKSFGIWSAEFTQDRTPGMTGMDRWIDWSRDDFIGHEAASQERSEGKVSQRLVTLEIDADDADASGYEPIWQNDKRVGFVTSGGYGHYTGKSLAMGLLDTGVNEADGPLMVDVVGKRRGAHTLAEPAWDPQGARIRG